MEDSFKVLYCPQYEHRREVRADGGSPDVFKKNY